jgi:ribonuclease P/MRP protein subunit POP1
MLKPTEADANKSINISRLFDARALELAHFIKAIEKREKGSTKTPMQRVPKHLRRRAMAHNRYRIPSRIR